MSFDVVGRKCLVRVGGHLSHAVLRKRRDIASDRSVTGAKGLHFLSSVTASLQGLVIPRSAQLLSAVFLERMSVFLRSTLDTGEVKRGEGGGQPFSSWHTPFRSELPSLFIFVSHPLSACWDATRPRCVTPSSPCYDSVLLSQVHGPNEK